MVFLSTKLMGLKEKIDIFVAYIQYYAILSHLAIGYPPFWSKVLAFASVFILNIENIKEQLTPESSGSISISFKVH